METWLDVDREHGTTELVIREDAGFRRASTHALLCQRAWFVEGLEIVSPPEVLNNGGRALHVIRGCMHIVTLYPSCMFEYLEGPYPMHVFCPPRQNISFSTERYDAESLEIVLRVHWKAADEAVRRIWERR